MSREQFGVKLRPMSAAEFVHYLENSVADYAAEKTRAGHWFADEALAQSQASFQRLLPDGLTTLNHHLFTIVDTTSDLPIGAFWIYLEQGLHSSIWIYDLIIHPMQRRKGYGRQAMLALETTARELGAERIDLHVFAHNRRAIALYKSVGYTTSSLNMSKLL